EDGDYTLEVGFHANNESTFTVEDADSPWEVLASGTGTEVVVTFDFSVAGGMYNEQNRLRFKAGDLDSYYVDFIKLFKN
ncbi:MAG: hypothetical protein FWC09_12200, partial [Lachnospiraceae bacterium]|nr:hypothetical protein [Lachnospiraceae bacterium]